MRGWNLNILLCRYELKEPVAQQKTFNLWFGHGNFKGGGCGRWEVVGGEEGMVAPINILNIIVVNL